MSVTRTTVGAQSASFLVTRDPDGEGFITEFQLTVDEWAALPEGKLKDVLNRTYLTPGGDIDPAAFIAAYAAAGAFQVTSTYVYEEIEDSQWVLSSGPSEEAPDEPVKGSPVLRVYAQPFGTAVRVSCSYSASE